MAYSLIDNIHSRYGSATARAAGDFFNRMALPFPHGREYTDTKDRGYIVFLNAAGCVLRLTHDGRFPLVRHPRVLQPLGSEKVRSLRIDINPGVRWPVERRYASELIHELEKDHVIFDDPAADNCGMLPVIDDSTPKDYAVVIDTADVRNLFFSCAAIAKILREKFFTPPSPVAPSPQEKLYGPLREVFHRIQAGTVTAPDFWNACKQMKRNGALRTDWLTPEMARCGFKNIHEGSQRYAARWKEPFTA